MRPVFWLGVIRFKKVLLYFVLTLALLAATLTLLGLAYTPNLEIPPGFKGKQIEVAGLRLRVHQTGSGPDVLFLHGGMGSLEDFDPLLQPLAGRFRLTMFDRPGMGYSETVGRAYSLEGAAEITLELIRALQLKDVLLVGHSYGGGIALTAATHNDPAIRGVVLIAPAAYSMNSIYSQNDSPAMRFLRVPYFGRGLAMVAGPLVGEKMIAGVLNPMTAGRPGISEDFLKFRQKLWNKAISTTTRARQSYDFERDMPAIAARYGSIKAPVTVLIGSDDLPELIVFVPQLKKDIPQIQVVELPGVNHYIQFENPDAVVQAIETMVR